MLCSGGVARDLCFLATSVVAALAATLTGFPIVASEDLIPQVTDQLKSGCCCIQALRCKQGLRPCRQQDGEMNELGYDCDEQGSLVVIERGAAGHTSRYGGAKALNK